MHIAAKQTRGQAIGVPLADLLKGKVGADDGRSALQQAGIDDIIQHRCDELAQKFCAQVVQNQQVTFQHQREVALRLVLCVVEAELFLFQLCQQVLRRTVDDPVSLVDDLSCNGLKTAGWAKTALC